jgi:hypothetical protein
MDEWRALPTSFAGIGVPPKKASFDEGLGGTVPILGSSGLLTFD